MCIRDSNAPATATNPLEAQQIEQALSGDETMEMVFMAQMDGYSPNEIQDLVGLSEVKYASTLRAIRRRLNKLDIERSGI